MTSDSAFLCYSKTAFHINSNLQAERMLLERDMALFTLCFSDSAVWISQSPHPVMWYTAESEQVSVFSVLPIFKAQASFSSTFSVGSPVSLQMIWKQRFCNCSQQCPSGCLDCTLTPWGLKYACSFQLCCKKTPKIIKNIEILVSVFFFFSCCFLFTAHRTPPSAYHNGEN